VDSFFRIEIRPVITIDIKQGSKIKINQETAYILIKNYFNKKNAWGNLDHIYEISAINHFDPRFRQCWHSIPDRRSNYYGAGNTGAAVATEAVLPWFLFFFLLNLKTIDKLYGSR